MRVFVFTFNYTFTFEHAGVANGNNRTQLRAFRDSLTDARDGAQIDMLIDRADNMVNICEMKYSKKEYVVTQDDSASLANKAERFSETVGSTKSITLTMITVNGIAKTAYWSDIHNSITAEDLFKG